MFYKFVGATEDALLDVFDKAVVQGSIKLGSATTFEPPRLHRRRFGLSHAAIAVSSSMTL